MATRACRCVEIVRRAGKSPPGGASRAAPRRASRGPSSSTDPRRRPTSVGSGRSVVTFAHWIFNVDVPMPSTVAPRPTSRSRRTCTSRIRGTLVSTHAWSVSRHAAISGSAEFLLPSTASLPDSRRPPSTFSTAIRPFIESEPDDLVFQLDTEPTGNLPPASFDQRHDVARRRAAVIHDEVAVARRYPGPPLRCILQAGTIDQSAGAGRDVGRHGVDRRVGVLEDAAGARLFERLRALSKGERLARDRAQVLGITAGHLEVGGNDDLPGAMKPAVVVPELHLGDRHPADSPGAVYQLDVRDQFRDEAALEVRVAVDRSTDRA